MAKDRKHIKRSKGERLHWANAATEKASVVYRSALDGRFLQPARVSENQNNAASARPDHKLLVP
jgi:hypothetical protein